MDPGIGFRYTNGFPKSYQTCSIGLRSGDLEGQYIRQIFSSPRKSSIMLALCGFALLSINIKSGRTTPRNNFNIGFKDLIPRAMCIKSTHIKDIQCCTTAQYYASPDKDFFTTKHVGFIYVSAMIESFTLSSDEDSTKITVCGKSRVNAEKNTPFTVVSTIDVFILTTTGLLLDAVRQIHVMSDIRYEVFDVHLRLFRSAVGPDFTFMDDNAKSNRAHIVDIFLKKKIFVA